MAENVALINEIARRLNDNTRRIRVLEEKVRSLELQIGNHDQRIMDANKEANTLSQVLGSDMSEIKERLAGMELDSHGIQAELKKMAQKADLREVQEYIELISPITTKFVTRGEIEELVRNEIKRWIAKNNVR